MQAHVRDVQPPQKEQSHFHLKANLEIVVKRVRGLLVYHSIGLMFSTLLDIKAINNVVNRSFYV